VHRLLARQVERPFRCVLQAFFLARCFRNLGDLNAQLRQWLDTVADVWVHATTLRVFFTYCHKRGQRTATTTLYELLQVGGVPVVKAGNRAMVSQGKSAALTHWVAISCNAHIRNRSVVPRGYRNTCALSGARRGSLATNRAVAWRLRACSCYARQRQQVRRT